MIITDMPDTRLGEMRKLADEGVTSYKLFMAYPGVLYVDDGTLYRAFRQAGENGTRICMHAENGIVIDEIIKEAKGSAHIDPNSTAEAIKQSIIRNYIELKKFSSDELIEKRIEKYNKIIPNSIIGILSNCPIVNQS